MHREGSSWESCHHGDQHRSATTSYDEEVHGLVGGGGVLISAHAEAAGTSGHFGECLSTRRLIRSVFWKANGRSTQVILRACSLPTLSIEGRATLSRAPRLVLLLLLLFARLLQGLEMESPAFCCRQRIAGEHSRHNSCTHSCQHRFAEGSEAMN